MRRSLRVGICLLSLVVALCVGAWWQTQDRLQITNNSGQVVRFISVTVGGETTRFDDLAQGASVEGRFHVQSDDHFVVRGELADGTAFNANCGYVTNGEYRRRARFEIGAGGNILFDQS